MESNGYPAESLLEPLTHINHINREHLTAIAESAVADHGYGTSTPSSPGQKRKRGTADSSPESSRRSKRNIPPAAYVEGAVEAARQAAQAAEAANHDLSVLQQATIERHEASDPANASSTAAAALNSIYPHIHIPQATQANAESANHHDSFNHNDVLQNHAIAESSSSEMSPPLGNGTRTAPPARYQTSDSVVKPIVGSEEWHKMRKDNHKNVERRRRENINEGINELAKIVPDCEKNKGSILSRAVAYIRTLKDIDASNIEKWTIEKLLTEQAITELTQTNDKLKAECERGYRETQRLKSFIQANGLEVPNFNGD